TRLFDLDTDPGERSDVAGRYPDRASWYERNLRRWIVAHQERVRLTLRKYFRIAHLQSAATRSMDVTFSRGGFDWSWVEPLLPTGAVSAGLVGSAVSVPCARTRCP